MTVDEPEGEVVASRYRDGAYVACHPDWHDADAGWKAAKVAAFLRTQQVRWTSLADVGCGSAGVLRHLAEGAADHARLVGLEPSPDAHALARELTPASSRIELHNRGLADGDHFDVVLVLDVIEHVPDLYGFLESLRGHALRFVFHVPLDLSVVGVARPNAMLRVRRVIGHLHWFTAETLRDTLQETGYEILAEQYTQPSVELEGGGVLRRMAALPRRLGARISAPAAARLLGGSSLLVLARPADGSGP